MMSYTASAVRSHPISSPCYIEHGQFCSAVLSGRITTVAMSRSGQLGLDCTVEPNCSGLSARLSDASVTHDRALETCEPSCVPGAVRLFFIPVVHSLLGVMGYVAAPELSSQGGEVWAPWQHQSPPHREVRSGAEEHVAASELSSRGGRARGHGTHDSAGAHLDREARSGVKKHVVVPELNSARR
jgi:hypothetical protein